MERSTRSSNRLPAPHGLGVRFRRSGRNPIGLEDDLFRLESPGQRRYSSEIQGQPETVVVRAVRRGIRVAVRRPAIRRVVVPAAATVHPVRASQDHPPVVLVPQRDGISNSSYLPRRKMQSGMTTAAAGSFHS